jgi:CRISPR/Cas system-associated endonuclease Cas1
MGKQTGLKKDAEKDKQVFIHKIKRIRIENSTGITTAFN